MTFKWTRGYKVPKEQKADFLTQLQHLLETYGV